jgi:hypothetical protein
VPEDKLQLQGKSTNVALVGILLHHRGKWLPKVLEGENTKGKGH